MDKGSKEGSTLAVIDAFSFNLCRLHHTAIIVLFSVYVVVEACSLKGRFGCVS
jgi:hypothetical protein